LNKKILIISHFNFFPPYWGEARRNYHLTKLLAKNNKLWVICNNEIIDENYTQNSDFKELSSNPNIKIIFAKYTGKSSKVFNPNVLREALRVIKKENPDLIISYFLWSAPQTILLKILKKVPFILDEHNVEFLRFERMKRGNKLARIVLKSIEKLSCRLASKIICVSETDRDLLINKLNINKEKFVIISNGIDTDKFFPNTQNDIKIRNQLNLSEKPIIIFFGTFKYIPNLEAVEIIYNEILPRIIKKVPDAIFLMVGKDPPLQFKHKNIIFTGMVNKIEDYINASNVVICPLISGGGTRFKIIEALACGKTVISTTIGAEGLDIKGNEDIIICDTWDEFSNKTISSLSKKSSKIHPNFIKKYTWDEFLPDIESLVNEVK